MRYIVAIIMCIMISVPVFAKYTGPSDQKAVAVADVKQMDDNVEVMLEGRIEKRIKADKYLFSDGDETIVVEIDDDKWKGLPVSDNDKIRIYGEVDTGLFHETKIEVKSIDILK